MLNVPKPKLPWLALVPVTIQFVALLLVTLVLVCPTPWEHSGISLFTVQPQKAKQTAAPLIATTTASSTSIAPSASPTITNSTNTTAPLPETSTARHSDASIAAQQAADVHNTPTAAAGAAETAPAAQHQRRDNPASSNAVPPRISEALPNSAGGMDSNGTVAAMSTTRSASEPRNDLLLRLGPLGSCYRTPTGQESCTPAKLTTLFDYGNMQRDIDAASNTSLPFSANGAQSFNSSSASSSINLGATLPDKMSVYPTILLLIIVALLCVSLLGGLHIVVLIQQARAVGQSSSMARALSKAPWIALVGLTKWIALSAGILLAISSGVIKYQLSNAKKAFNTASPAMFPPADYGGNPADDRKPVLLQADTGNAFGYLWTACLGLVASFWIQRTFLRRHAALQRARKELHDGIADEAASSAALTMMDSQGSLVKRSGTLPPYSPPDLKRSPSAYSCDHVRPMQHKTSLPSLHKAYEFAAHTETKGSPPFSRYQADFDTAQSNWLRRMHGTGHPSPVGHLPSLRYEQDAHAKEHAEVLDEYEPCDCCTAQTGTVLRRQHTQRCCQVQPHDRQVPAPGFEHYHGGGGNRIPSPAPSYWTTTTAEWGPREKELERQFMAELRRQRSAMNCR